MPRKTPARTVAAPAAKPKPPTRTTERHTPKVRIERDAVYSIAELRAITEIGRETIYSVVRRYEEAQGIQRPPRRKHYITGGDFLAHLAASA